MSVPKCFEEQVRIEWQHWDVVLRNAEQELLLPAGDATITKVTCACFKKGGASKGIKCARCNNRWFDVFSEMCFQAFRRKQEKTVGHTVRLLSCKMAEESHDHLKFCLL